MAQREVATHMKIFDDAFFKKFQNKSRRWAMPNIKTYLFGINASMPSFG